MHCGAAATCCAAVLELPLGRVVLEHGVVLERPLGWAVLQRPQRAGRAGSAAAASAGRRCLCGHGGRVVLLPTDKKGGMEVQTKETVWDVQRRPEGKKGSFLCRHVLIDGMDNERERRM
jgi:hypothetical protein